MHGKPVASDGLTLGQGTSAKVGTRLKYVPARFVQGRAMKSVTEKTEVIQGERRVIDSIIGSFSRTKVRLDLSASYIGPKTGIFLVEALQSARKKGVNPRLVTEVTPENAKAMKVAANYLEVRHIGNLGGNSWAVTDGEYLSSLVVGEFNPAFPTIYSNANSLVREHQSIFEALWQRGEPLQERVEALEGGVDLPELEILRDSERIKELYVSLPNGATRRILLLLPTPNAFRRDEKIGIIDGLERAAARGVSVRLLTPADVQVLSRLRPLNTETAGGLIDYRIIQHAETRETVTILVVDNSISLTLDESSPDDPRFDSAVGSAVLATREPRVRQSIRLFERVWMESELRASETKARERAEISQKRAELMQDILTHDIRNFNQVARLNAELLAEKVTDKESAKRLGAIIRAVDGSTRLIERAKKLGGIMSTSSVQRRPISVRASFARALLLVKKGNPNSKIQIKSDLRGEVLADELLDDVFLNVLSNAVKYTEGDRVLITVEQDSSELPGKRGGGPTPCWTISLSDRGKGIPDSQKSGIFRRYLETAKGSGLGLSIVHALVVDRYDGRVAMEDRVRGDYTKGAKVVIWSPKT